MTYCGFEKHHFENTLVNTRKKLQAFSSYLQWVAINIGRNLKFLRQSQGINFMEVISTPSMDRKYNIYIYLSQAFYRIINICIVQRSAELDTYSTKNQ